MYKIFFEDRCVYLSERIPEEKPGSAQVYLEFRGQSELKELLEDFSGNEQLREMFVFHPNMELLTEAFTSCFKCISAGGGVVLNEKGEFLVIKRNGVWDLPKGKMEKGEDFESTALREVEEETGLSNLEVTGLLLSTFHTYPHKGRTVLKETQWFEMRWRGTGSPKLQSEEGITESRWVKPGECAFIIENTYASILDVLRLRNLL